MFIERLPVLIRYFLLLLLLAWIPTWIGMTFAGVPGAVAAFFVSYCALLFGGTRSQDLIAQALRAKSDLPSGVQSSTALTFKAVSKTTGIPVSSFPEVRIYPDSFSNVVVVRSVGGSGLILLSQGFLNQATEAEFREALAAAVSRCFESDWVFTSLCAALCVLLFRAAPKHWSEVFYSKGLRLGVGGLGVSDFLLFCLILPWVRLLQKLAGRVPSPPLSQANALCPSGSLVQLGGAMLYLFHPESPEQLLSGRSL